MTRRQIFVTGAIATGLSVAIGAFGAHGLKSHTDAAGLSTWETAVRYQAIHGLALLIIASTLDTFSKKAGNIVYWCFLLGILIFSGSLYALVLSGIKGLGAIAPVGGILFLAGWLAAIVCYRPKIDDLK